MIKRTSQTLSLWFVTWDIVLTAVAWLAAYPLRFHAGWLPVLKPPPGFDLCLANLPVVLFLAIVGYQYAGQYEVHRLRRFREEMLAVCRGVALMALLVIASSFYRQDAYESRATMGIFLVLTLTLLLAARRATWTLLKRLRSRGFNPSNVVIVGTGRVARKTAKAFTHASWMGLHNVGFVEDAPGRWSDDLTILGSIADLPRLVEQHHIRHVFIALPLNRCAEARRVFDVLSRSLVEVRVVLDVPNFAGLSLTTTTLDGLPVVGLRESPHFGLNIVVKRAMDIVLSALALVLLAPAFAIIAALVKSTSRGPVFYRQERCGLNGQSFWMLKFRSMFIDSERAGPGWTTKGDPRVTWIGGILRKTSLDELPQFWNVLTGEMSLVGPRPERPVYIQKFSASIPNYMARHTVKCGITGWAQVHGWRGDTSLRKRLQYDLYYITHWTPWLDLRILWMTLWAAWGHRNAY
jgi:Undecaprenyl-phosphate glucose phosphotransferase